MTDEEILLLIDEIIKELPDDVRDTLKQVSITVDDEPTDYQMSRLRRSQRKNILGLYEGVPYPHQSFFSTPMHPPAITLFRRNIERFTRGREELKLEIQNTLLHEIGHHLGLTEEDLWKRER